MDVPSYWDLTERVNVSAKNPSKVLVSLDSTLRGGQFFKCISDIKIYTQFRICHTVDIGVNCTIQKW